MHRAWGGERGWVGGWVWGVAWERVGRGVTLTLFGLDISDSQGEVEGALLELLFELLL